VFRISRFEDTIELALRRSIFFPSSDIYPSSPSGIFDFGPIGQSIRNNIVAFWRRHLVAENDMLEIRGAQVMPEAVFESSGHLKGFSDPLVQCQRCHAMHRADKVIADATGEMVPEGTDEAELDERIRSNGLVCPSCKGPLSEVKKFNLMMGVKIGPLQDQQCYLRPETCQSIFCDYLRISKTMRVNLPFGIAQEGTAFRNEISPRNFLIRQREFSQIECEVFFDPEEIDDVRGFDDASSISMRFLTLDSEEPEEFTALGLVERGLVSGKLVAFYLAEVQRVWELMGFPHEALRFREVGEDEKPFYSRETWDFEAYSDQLGWVELVANNYRMDYDLKGHQEGSSSDLRWKTQDGRKFIPHVWEISAGLDRTLLCLLENSLMEDEKHGHAYFSLRPQIAPFLVSVFPLVKKDGLPDIAKGIVEDLRTSGHTAFYDQSGSIGRRYARVDEVGCPYAVTVDYRTKDDDTVTLRERDSTEQKRVKKGDIPVLIWRLYNGVLEFQEIKSLPDL
jgi:glycyl-tRNA synthetase